MYGPVIRGALATLRPPRVEDAAHQVRWRGDFEVTRYAWPPFPPSLAHVEEFVRKGAKDANGCFWTLEVEGEPIGLTFIRSIDWVARVGTTGTAIGERRHWRKGIASEVMALRTEFAFRELDLHKLKADAYVDDVGSRRALEKAGYRTAVVAREDGFVDGRWLDAWQGEVLRDDWERARAGR